LLTSDSAEGHENCEVNGTGIIKYAAYNSLDLFDILVGEGGRIVKLGGSLCSADVLFWLRIIGTVLGAGGGCVLVTLEMFDNVTGHGNVKGAVDVIPAKI
jgi:hypothetical protein